MKIVLIGAGNVATQLGLALQSKNYPIAQIYSRTTESASLLARRLESQFTTDTKAIIPDADLYILSLKDDAIETVLQEIPHNKGLYIHTAGSVPLHIFQPFVQRYGVMYPLQTFSKSRDISFDHIPILYEAANEADAGIIHTIAQKLSDTVFPLDSKKRKEVHLAAVFACNFTNHMYTLASEILEEKNIPWNFLVPLITETAEKVRHIHPFKAQTGPAIRHDRQTMQKHMEMLSDEDKKTLYEIISKSIEKQSDRK